MKYFIIVAFIWIGCVVAWVLLGSTLIYRSETSSSTLTGEVDQLWGPPLVQEPPVATYKEIRTVKEKVKTRDAHGNLVETETEKEYEQHLPIPLASSRIRAGLALEHRRKGLLWFPTYAVDFQGEYEFHNDTGAPREVAVAFPLGSENAVYDGFSVTRADGEPEPFSVGGGVTQPSTASRGDDPEPPKVHGDTAHFTAKLAPGEHRNWKVRYRSRGRTEWRYRLTQGTGRVERFALELTTNFANVDFPPGTLAPSRHARVGSGWRGEWRFDSLISSAPIGVELPQKLNPGPLASKMTFFAPVGLLFFFFVVAVLSAGRKEPIHPMHYFFLGCSFFAFHLLFAYLVDHLSIAVSFAIAACVSVFLVVSYVRLFRGMRMALATFGVAQLIYLVLFSSTFFWQGYTGLAIAVLAVLTLFVIMQITGRVRWGEPITPKGSPLGAVAP